MPCQIFIFDKYIFEKIDRESIELYKNTLQPYFSDKVLKENYFENIRWRIFKNKLFNNIQIEKKNTNKARLIGRTPIMIPEKNLTLRNVKLPRIILSRSKTQPKIRKKITVPDKYAKIID